MNVPSPRTIIPLRVTRRSTVNFLVYCYDLTLTQVGAEASRELTDLTGAVLYFTVRDRTGTTVIEKNSLTTSQIEILDQSTNPGQARVKVTGADTASLDVGTYSYDVWAQLADGRVEPVIDRSTFHVMQEVVEIPVGEPEPVAGTPASQAPQERSFSHTVAADGDSFTVTIPGTGMVDSTYTVLYSFADIPEGGGMALLAFPTSGRTATEFLVAAAGTLVAGTVIDFILRDA